MLRSGPVFIFARSWANQLPIADLFAWVVRDYVEVWAGIHLCALVG
jgi:hypothetical protein